MGVRVRPPDARRLEDLADERLGHATGDGDGEAFEVLYRRHQPAVLAFCRHMLGRADEAQDVAQQTFLAAYRVMRSGEAIGALRPWLFTVARNRCISLLRARREHSSAVAAEPATQGLAAEVQTRADLRALLRDVAELPDDQRAALLLAELADLPHGEIAAVIGVRREKVKALVFQARRTLLAAKDARETPCTDVRAELATARGAALRRAPLRRHLHACVGCREFRDQLREQRRALRLLLPLVPPALRDLPLGAAAGTSAGAGAAGVGAAGVKTIVAKLAIGVTLTGGAAVGGTAVVAPEPAIDRGAATAQADGGTSATAALPRGGANVLRAPTDGAAAPANDSIEGGRSMPATARGRGVALRGSISPIARHTSSNAKAGGTKPGGTKPGGTKNGGAKPGGAKRRGLKPGRPKGGGTENGGTKKGGLKRGWTRRGESVGGAANRGRSGRGATRRGGGATNGGGDATNRGGGATKPGGGGTNRGGGTSRDGTATTPGVGATNRGLGGTNRGVGGTNRGGGATKPGGGATNPGTDAGAMNRPRSGRDAADGGQADVSGAPAVGGATPALTETGGADHRPAHPAKAKSD
jgi:RNA polymerase sigma factor (sigma-70 family)